MMSLNIDESQRFCQYLKTPTIAQTNSLPASDC